MTKKELIKAVRLLSPNAKFMTEDFYNKFTDKELEIYYNNLQKKSNKIIKHSLQEELQVTQTSKQQQQEQEKSDKIIELAGFNAL